MGKHNPSEQLGEARPPRPTFTSPRKKTFTHDNTFAGSSVGVSPGTRRLHHQHSDFDFDAYDHKYSINKNFPGTSNGPHIKGVHSYILSDNKKDYTHDNYGSFLSNKHPGKRFSDFDDLDDLDFSLGKRSGSYGLKSGKLPSAYESKVSAQSTLYQSELPRASRSPYNVYTSPLTRSSPVPSSPVLPRRSAPVGSSPSFVRRSPSPVRRTQVPSSYTSYRKSPSPATSAYTSPIRRTTVPSSYRKSPSPSPAPVAPSASLHRSRRSESPAVSTSTIYRSSTPSISVPPTPSVSRRASPSPVNRSFVSQVSATPPPQRRASIAHPSPSSQTRASFAYPSTQRRQSFCYPEGTQLRRSPVVSLSSAAPTPTPTPTPPGPQPLRASTALRRHSIAVTSFSPVRRRVPQSAGTTTTSTETFTKHAPVYARRFPERYTLITSTLKPVYREVETDIDIPIESEIIEVPSVPRYLGRRHSLDTGLAKMDTLGTMDLYSEQAIRTTRSMSRPPRPRPMHPPISRPEYIERPPLYDVDLYWVTRQQLLEEPDFTSKFRPLRNRLHRIGHPSLQPEPSQIMVSPVSRAGEIPHFTSDFEPYDPLYRTRRVRPGGPLYIHSVGEDPRTLTHSELEPLRKDGVVCVMVVRGHTGGGGGTHSYHQVSSRVSGGSGGGDSFSLPLSAHSLGSSSLAGGAGLGSAGLGTAGLGKPYGVGHHHTPSYHRIPDFLDLAEPDVSSHVRPYIPLGGRGGAGGVGGAGGRRPHHGLGGAGLGGHVPYVPTHTPGHHVPVHASPYHSAPTYHGPGSYGGGGHGGGHPYHHTPVALGDDTYLSPHRGGLPRESRAASMPVGEGAPPVEHFKGKPRHWEPAKAREVPAGHFAASRPPRHVEPPLSDVRRRARDVICKTRNDPHYYDL